MNTPTELGDLFDDAEVEGVEEAGRGRHFIKWRTIQNLDANNTPMMMAKLRDNMGSGFYLQHVFSHQVRNIENGDVTLHYTNRGSPWFNFLAEAESWMNEQEGLEGLSVRQRRKLCGRWPPVSP